MQPKARVAVSYRGEVHAIVADHEGWWAFLREADDEGVKDDNDDGYSPAVKIS